VSKKEKTAQQGRGKIFYGGGGGGTLPIKQGGARGSSKGGKRAWDFLGGCVGCSLFERLGGGKEDGKSETL